MNGNITKIKIEPDESNRTDILQMIEDIRLTPLETGDHCLIGKMTNMKADEDCIYIMNRFQHDPVKVFSKDGTFITEAGHKGVGPGEFIQITEMLTDPDTVSIFAWSGNRKWIRYSRNNQFLYETDMTFPFDEICRFGDDRFLVYVANSTVSRECTFNLYCLDKNLNVLQRLEPKVYPTDIPLVAAQNHFYRHAGQLFYIKEYVDTIYTISENLDICPKYHLDFGKYWYTTGFLKKYHDHHYMDIHNAINRNKYARWVDFWETDDHLLIRYSTHRMGNGMNDTYTTHLAAHFKKTGKTFNFRDFAGDVWADLLMLYPYCMQDGWFTGLIAADKLLDIASKMEDDDAFSEKVRQCASQVTETDNPVLVRFRFKSQPGDII